MLPLTGCPAVHCAGGVASGCSTSFCRSSDEGGGSSAQPASATAPRKSNNRARATLDLPQGLIAFSVQLENEPVQVRTDTHDHAADDVNVVTMLRVDGAVSDGTCCEIHVLVAVGDVEPYGEAAGRRWRSAGLWQVRAHGDLSLALRPHDGVH